jgi:VIT1/CCC1 family predicted Fe2+/Mn2+ transporter
LPLRLEHSHTPSDIAKRLHHGPHVSYLRDWVYGGIDGTVTTFAVMAGVVGVSMAAANFTGTKAERDEYEQLRNMEERHVALVPDGEREEIRQIFQAKGLEGEALEAAVTAITSQRERWIDTMMAEEHGMPAAIRSPLKAGLTTFVAFVLCGSLPLLPYALELQSAETLSAVLAGVTFFAIGSFRSHWSPAPWWRAGLETFAIGMVAAGVAYLVGDLLKGFI